MQKILEKGLGFLTVFALVFGLNGLALAQVPNPNDNQNCNVVAYSDDADASLQVDLHNAVAVAPINPGWTASIPGAEWVWSEVNVLDATVDTTKTFTKTFTIAGTPTGGTLEIAADNSYEVSVNGNVDVFVDALENNYASGATAVPGDGQDTHVIPAGYLQTGVNTITFEVKNIGIAGSNSLDNPAGLMYKVSVDCTPIPVEPVCVPGNLVVNGGFEMPVVTNGAMWDIFDDGTAGLGWDVAWYNAPGAPATAKLELHRGVAGWLSDEGSQHAELDADWQGPAGTSGEAASVVISQILTTVPGVVYDLTYAYSPRPDMDTLAGENVLEVLVNGLVVATETPDGVDDANTTWTPNSWVFVGTGSDTISFRDAGLPANSVGTFLDDVSVNCDDSEQPEVCTQVTPLFARINMKTDDATKLRNWGAGDMAPYVYVGGNTLAEQYDMGEWFPLTNPDGSFINDAWNLDTAANSDVAGLAVQRMEGRVRVVLYGFHETELIGKELAAGSVELSSDATVVKTRLNGAWDKTNNVFVDPIDAYTRIHDVTVNDAANPMDSRGDFNGYIHQYNPRFDNVRVFNHLFQFHLVVTTGSDGFYADYDFDSVEEVPCEEVNPQ